MVPEEEARQAAWNLLADAKPLVDSVHPIDWSTAAHMAERAARILRRAYKSAASRQRV